MIFKLKVHGQEKVRDQSEVIEYIAQPKDAVVSEVWYQLTFLVFKKIYSFCTVVSLMGIYFLPKNLW